MATVLADADAALDDVTEQSTLLRALVMVNKDRVPPDFAIALATATKPDSEARDA